MRHTILLAALACAALVAGCGGGHKPSQHAAATVAGRPCTPADYFMQCALQTQRPSTALTTPFAARLGWDFAWSCPRPAGRAFGASYLSFDASKNWTRGCVNAYHTAGAGTVAVWETSSTRATDGFNAGFNDAFTARSEARGVGEPDSRPIDYAVDCDCTTSSILAYFQGDDAGTASDLHISRAAAVRLVGIYGGYYQVRAMYLNRVVGSTNWQTYAWSGGRWLSAQIAPLEQYLNSNAVDYDRAIAPDYGQWPYVAPKPPNTCGVLLTVRWTFYGERASECNTVHTWNRARCRNPVRRGVCVSSRRHLIWLRDRLWRVAHANHICISVSTCAPINWRYAHRGVRLQLLERPIGNWQAEH